MHMTLVARERPGRDEFGGRLGKLRPDRVEV